MKFRTDFVTNSSSSGFVSVNVKSIVLNKILKDHNFDLTELIKRWNKSLGGCSGYPGDVSASVSDSICTLLDDFIKYVSDMREFDTYSELGASEDEIKDKIKVIQEKIQSQKEQIDKSATAEIESADDGTEEPGYVNYTGLILENGVGELYSIKDEGYIVCGCGDDEGCSNYPEADDKKLAMTVGKKMHIENGITGCIEDVCKDDFVYYRSTLLRYQGDINVRTLVIPFKYDWLTIRTRTFSELKNIECVIIPEGVTYYSDGNAFLDKSFTYVLPASLGTEELRYNDMADIILFRDSYRDYSVDHVKKVIISAPSDSYSAQYALEKGFVFIPSNDGTPEQSVLDYDKCKLKEYGSDILDTAVKLVRNIKFLTKYDLLDREQTEYLLMKTDNVEIKAILLEYSRKFSCTNTSLGDLELGESFAAEDRGNLSGKTFVVSGKLKNYTADSFKDDVEKYGGRVTGKVSSKTSYVVTNTSDAGTTNLRKAVELAIPVISEEEFMKMINQ